jgi:hypothetical protein
MLRGMGEKRFCRKCTAAKIFEAQGTDRIDRSAGFIEIFFNFEAGELSRKGLKDPQKYGS